MPGVRSGSRSPDHQGWPRSLASPMRTCCNWVPLLRNIAGRTTPHTLNQGGSPGNLSASANVKLKLVKPGARNRGVPNNEGWWCWMGGFGRGRRSSEGDLAIAHLVKIGSG